MNKTIHRIGERLIEFTAEALSSVDQKALEYVIALVAAGLGREVLNGSEWLEFDVFNFDEQLLFRAPHRYNISTRRANKYPTHSFLNSFLLLSVLFSLFLVLYNCAH